MNLRNGKISNPIKNGFLSLTFITMLVIVFFISCGGDEYVPAMEPVKKDEVSDEAQDTVEVIDPTEFDTSMIYVPKEFKSSGFNNSTSQWYFGRSKQSEHFIVLWEEGFGLDPNDNSVSSTYRVDIDKLLNVAEASYDEYVDNLDFADVGEGSSLLDKYKMMIFLFYTTDWTSYGAGYDNVIGAIWQSPGTMQPAGSTIAHEIGHAFQYQTCCDLLVYGGITDFEKYGFRYGWGGNGGNSFWEQCAQWQSYQLYPEQAFTSPNFNVHMEECHRHFCHEWQRYASYWLHYYWADKHGKSVIGRIWRESVAPEDPIETYMRLFSMTVDELNDEIYEAASKFVTWDIDAIRDIGRNYIGLQSFKSTKLDDGSYQVTYDKCLGTTGYNVIPLNVPEAGLEIQTEFTGMVNATGFNSVDDPGRAGWRYGYVALLDNGSTVYGDMNQGASNTVSFTCPVNCSKLWFVVTGAPSTYAPHPWDEDESNDDQWPYKVKFTNTNLFGNLSFGGTETPEDLTLSYEVGFPFSETEYVGSTVQLGDDLLKLAKAFVLQPSDISGLMDSKIKFYAVESNDELNATITANGYGQWFDANGNVISWGEEAIVFSEYDSNGFTFSLGQYPDHCSTGDEFTIKQSLVYEYETGKTVQATFVFHITIQ